MLYAPRYNGATFGQKCIYNRCIMSWNKYTVEINKTRKQKFVNKMRTTDIDFLKISRTSLKETITKHILAKYTDE